MSANHIQSDHACEVESSLKYFTTETTESTEELSQKNSVDPVCSVIRVFMQWKIILLQDKGHLSCACQKEYNPEA
jgi:hypothetical protein